MKSDDVQNQTVSVYRRKQGIWETVSADDIGQTILRYFAEAERQIREDSEVFLEGRIKTTDSYDTLVDLVKQNYIVRFDFCGQPECGRKLERDSVGEILGSATGERARGNCMGCQNKATVIGYFSRRAQSP